MNITRLQTILAAIACAAAAAAIYLWVPAMQGNVAPGLATLAMLLIGWAVKHPADAAALAAASTTTTVSESVTQPTADKPVPRIGTDYGPKVGVVLTLVLGSLLHSAPAQAQSPQAVGCVDAANTWCVVPAVAVGWQINLQTGSVANGVGLVGLQMQHEFGSLPLGAGLYFGLGASTQNQMSYQGCVGISITNWGLVCLGPQHASFSDGSTAWQAMATFAPQLTFGGTPAYVQKTATMAAERASAGAK